MQNFLPKIKKITLGYFSNLYSCYCLQKKLNMTIVFKFTVSVRVKKYDEVLKTSIVSIIYIIFLYYIYTYILYIYLYYIIHIIYTCVLLVMIIVADIVLMGR